MGNFKKDNMLEKIYTPESLTLYMLNHLKTYYNGVITQFLEPAAGAGNIIDVLYKEYPSIPVIAYDIFNETKRNDICESNFLKEMIEYKKGRVTIMNPPFSYGNKFLKKCISISDFVISITGVSTVLNFDYSLAEVKKIDIFKNMIFSDGKSYKCAVIVIDCRNKKSI